MPKYKYGLKPDHFDARDFVYRRAVKADKLPKSVDLRDNMPEVYDQGQIGSCTSNAGVGLLEYIQNVNKTAFVPLSRLFLYYQTRALEDCIGEDGGAEMIDLMKAMQQVGVCPETDWPYVESTFTGPPTEQAMVNAVGHKITSYHRVQDLDDLKAALAEGHPVPFGFEVYESFESDRVAKTGVCPMPKRSEQLLGGHAVLAVGYDDGLLGSGNVIVRNSWGADWGQCGYFTMSYRVFEKLVMDMWVGM